MFLVTLLMMRSHLFSSTNGLISFLFALLLEVAYVVWWARSCSRLHCDRHIIHSLEPAAAADADADSDAVVA